MSRIHYVQEVLDDLARHLGAPGFSLDGNDEAQVRIDELTVNLRYQENPLEMLFLSAPVPVRPAERQHVINTFQLCLGHWLYTGICLGFDERSDCLLAYSPLPVADLTTRLLEERLTSFFHCMQGIQQQICATATV